MIEIKTTPLLNRNNAKKLFPDVVEESYTPGIVHLGLGAFHRAHQALITDECMRISGDNHWGIIAANIRSGRQLIEHMQAQDNLYTVTETREDGPSTCKLVSAIVETLYAGQDDRDGIPHLQLLARMANPNIQIVTFTVTEKGYGFKSAVQPFSAIDLIVAALAKRYEQGLQPFTVLSCDNIPENGRRTRNAVLQLARQHNAELAKWIEDQGAFPCTMVDRIVPAVSDNELNNVEASLGVRDNCAIVCEEFRQWIIEDHFVAGAQARPPWDLVAGVKFVANVKPWEDMKLRMLNGAHSFLAYTGFLGGLNTINEVMQSPCYAWAARTLMLKEAAPTLSIKECDLPDYAEQLIRRFRNPTLAHKTQQIAMDGSQKIPQRWLNTIRWHLKNGSDFPILALGLAAWMQYVSGIDEQGQVIEVSDPLADELKAIADKHSQNIENRTRAFLAQASIFTQELAHDNKLASSVVYFAQQLHSRGIKAVLTQMHQR